MLKFENFHPITNLTFYALVITFTLIANHPVLIAISLVAALIYDISKRKSQSIKTLTLFLLPTAVLIIAINFIFSHHGVTNLFTSQSGVNYTLESLVTGVITAAKFIATVLWFFSCSVILDEEKTIFLFGKISPKIALVISMSLRFIPLMTYQYDQISQAQKGLGKKNKEENIIKKIKAVIQNISILITWQLENAIETANSMTARGYGLKGKSRYNRFSFKSFDLILFLLYALSFAMIFSATLTGKLECFYTPIIMISQLSTLNILALSSWIMLCVSPILIDSRKDI